MILLIISFASLSCLTKEMSLGVPEPNQVKKTGTEIP